jgi:hypothetical protein
MTTTTIAVPTSCAALCPKLTELAQRIDDEIAQAGSGAAFDYGALELRVADALGEVERGLHAQVLARLDIDVPAIRAWGDEYRRIGRAESDYHTLAGTVRVMRTVYRKTERNGAVATGLGGHHFHRHRRHQGPPRRRPRAAGKWRGLTRPCRQAGRMKRRRVQVTAWTLVYSWRMDSRYVGSVPGPEVTVQFSSLREDGRARSLRVDL